nr:hypothetical protein [Brucella intermedia]
MTPKGIKALNDLAEASRLAHIRQRNCLILEAAIAAMLDADDPFTVAEILREHADQLVEYL